MQSKNKLINSNILRVVIAFIITGIAFWLVFIQVDFALLRDNFSRLSFPSLILVVILFSIGLLLRGLACKIILGANFSFMKTFHALNVGYLLNSIFPFRLGEIGRALLLKDHGRTKSSFFEVLASIITERVLDILIGSVFFLVTLPLVLENDFLKRLAWSSLAIMVVLIVIAAVFAKKRIVLIDKLNQKFQTKQAIVQRLLPKLNQLLIGFQFFLKPIQLISVLSLMIVSWLFSMVELAILQRQLLPLFEWWWPALVIPAGAFINALPSAPAGLGVFEAGIVGSYGLVGVSSEPALAMAVIIHAVQVIIPSLLGIIGIYILGEKLGNLFRRSSQSQLERDKLQ